jgi:prevent-host-death family protein
MLFMEVNIHEAKTHLSRLLRRAVEGEEVIISHAGKPLVRLVAIQANEKVRPLGMDRGKIWVADDFDAPLPDDLLREFYGGDLPKLLPEEKTREKKKKKR